MVRTRVGYTGGQKPHPTYYNLGDHSEAIQIDYDPTQISYETLLEIFWNSHNPTSRAWSRQYMSALFFHNDEQQKLVLETKTRQAARVNGKFFKRQITTEILPATEFYLAEDYHQKYMVQHVPALMKELADIYPNHADFVNSTAVARVNGYVAGYGTLAGLEAVLDNLGLSPAGRQTLLEQTRRFNRP